MIYIFNRDDQLEAVLSNENKKACPIIEADFDEKLNAECFLRFVVPANHSAAKKIQENGSAAIKRKNGKFEVFIIKDIEVEHADSVFLHVNCHHAISELNDDVINYLFVDRKNSYQAAESILTGTRWTLDAASAAIGTHNLTVRGKTALEALTTLAERWEVEFSYNFEFDKGQILRRNLQLHAQRGQDAGRRFEYSRDITEIRRTIDAKDLKTALYGYGKAAANANIETGEEETQLNFAGVEYTTETALDTVNLLPANISNPQDETGIFGWHWGGDHKDYISADSPNIAGVNSSFVAEQLEKDTDFLAILNGDKKTPVTALTTYTGSVYAKCSAAREIQLYIMYYDQDTKKTGEHFKTINITADTWTRISVKLQAPADTTQALLELRVNNVKIGDKLYWAAAQLEEGELTPFVLDARKGEQAFNKPAGQIFVEDIAARDMYGRLNEDGTRRHLFGTVTIDTEDAEELLLETKKKLDLVKDPKITYELKVLDLAQILGINIDYVELGDTIGAIDRDLDIFLKARIIHYKQNLLDPQLNEIILGNFIPAFTQSQKRLEQEAAEAKRAAQLADSRAQNQLIPNNVLREGDTIETNWLEDEIELLTQKIRAGQGTVTIEDNRGILIEEDPEGKAGGAIKLVGGMLALADSYNFALNDYDWRSFGTGSGWLADLVQTGKLTFNNASGGELVLGGENNQNGVFIVRNEDGEEIAQLNGNYGGFGRLRIDELVDTKNVIFKTSQYSANLINDAIYYYVDPSDGSDEADGTEAAPLKTVQAAIDRLPKYLAHDVYIYYVPTLLADDSIWIEGFLGEGALYLRKWPIEMRYFRDWSNGSTANTGKHWVEFAAYTVDGTDVLYQKTDIITNGTPPDSSRPLTIATDGGTSTSNYTYVTHDGAAYIDVYSAGGYTNIKNIKVWHYYGDGRTYHDTKIQVSPDRIRYFTLFDSTRQGEYAETAEGHEIDVLHAYLKGRLVIQNNTCIVDMKDCIADTTGINTYPAFLSRNMYCMLTDVVGIGDVNYASYAFYAYGTRARLSNCEFNNAKNACIIAAYGSQLDVVNCLGGNAPTGLYAYTASIISGYGTAPKGTTNNTKNDYGAHLTATWTHQTGNYTPITVTEKTQTWTNTSSDSWNDSANGWHTADDDPLQGKWDTNLGLYRGCWFFGSSMRDAVNGKTIKSIKVWVERANSSGYSTAVPIIIRWHGYASKPSYAPIMSGEFKTVNLARGQNAWVDVTAEFKAKFNAGSVYGIAIYTSDTSATKYARMTQTCKVQITYEDVN